MYCGYYGEIDGHRDDTLFYIGINLHWNGYYFGLPQLPKGKEWTLYASTDQKEEADAYAKQGGKEPLETVQEIYVGPRTIVIYMSRNAESLLGKERRKS